MNVSPIFFGYFRMVPLILAGLLCFAAQAEAATTLVEAEDGGQVTPTGSWTSAWGPRYSGDRYMRTTGTGDKLSFTFTGQSISVIFAKGKSSGIADITIDGTPYPSFDCYDNDTGYPMSAVVYREVMISNSLSAGPHTIEVTVSSSYSKWLQSWDLPPTVGIDAFRYADFAASAIKGKIYDVDCPGVGIGEVDIQIDNGTDTFSCVSPDDGEYGISCIPAGTYDMTVSKAEYQTLNRASIVVGTTETVVDNFVLPEAPGHFLYGKIFQPRMASMPAFAPVGGSFDIEFKAGASATNWDVSISAFEKTISLNTTPAFDAANNYWILTADIPAGTPLGLYDLTVNSSEGNDTKINAVKVVSAINNTFYYIHMNDMEIHHSQGFWDDYVAGQNEFNIINPEFVLIDGDLSYHPDNNANEFPDLLAVYSDCIAPIGISPGNHDIVTNNQDKIIVGPSPNPDYAVWKHFFGSPCYEFDYGQAHFIGMEQTCDLGGSMDEWDPDQLDWIKASLSAHPASLNIIYGHPVLTDVPAYFYPFCEAYGVDIAVGGHGTFSSFTQNGVYYMYPGSTVAQLYSLVRINGTNYTRTMLGGYNLSKSYSGANDGTQTTLTATIDNGYSEHFENSLTEFIMAPGVYATDTGTILQQFNNDANTKTFVHVTLDLPASAVTNITVSPAGDTITVTSPNGGEYWLSGGTETVTWSSTGTVGNVKIELSTDGGSSWTTLVADTANDGTEDVSAPVVESTQCLIRVSEASDADPMDTSNGNFTITATPPLASITVTYPNGGETWTGGSTEAVTWSTTGTVGNVDIELSTDGGSTWSSLAANTANDGSENVTVPGVDSTTCLIRISEASDGDPVDTSDGNFTISSSGPAAIDVTYPTGGLTWTGGTTETVTWTYSGITQNVNIWFSDDNGTTWTNLAPGGTPCDGSEDVLVPNADSTQCKILVKTVDDTVEDWNDGWFTVVSGADTTPPTVLVTSIVIDGTATDAEMNPPIVTVAGTNLGPVATFSQEVTLTGGTITVTAQDTTNTITINLDVTVP